MVSTWASAPVMRDTWLSMNSCSYGWAWWASKASSDSQHSKERNRQACSRSSDHQ